MTLTGTARTPDHLSTANVISDGDVDALEEGVRRADATVVRDDDVQGSGNAACERHDAVVAAADLGARGCGEVDPRWPAA